MNTFDLVALFSSLAGMVVLAVIVVREFPVRYRAFSEDQLSALMINRLNQSKHTVRVLWSEDVGLGLEPFLNAVAERDALDIQIVIGPSEAASPICGEKTADLERLGKLARVDAEPQVEFAVFDSKHLLVHDGANGFKTANSRNFWTVKHEKKAQKFEERFRAGWGHLFESRASERRLHTDVA